MWTDIDYMDRRWVFTLDPERFPLARVREVVDYLHAHNQHYIVMVDPAIAYQNYPTFNRGVDRGVLLKQANGTIHKGVVWPGVTAYPDWFHPSTQAYWNTEFKAFFDSKTGVDIDGVWIDMNEPANFCSYPCLDPEGAAKDQGLPPVRLPVRDIPRRIPGFPSTNGVRPRAESVQAVAGLPAVAAMSNAPAAASVATTRGDTSKVDLINPPYAIANDANGLSDRTVDTDIVHYGGFVEYDTHNLYGTSESSPSPRPSATGNDC